MGIADWRTSLRTRLDRYRSHRVLVAWAVITIAIVGYVFVRVDPRIAPDLPVARLGWLTLLLGWIGLTAWSRRPWDALWGTVLVGVAAFSVALGCPAIGCQGPRTFQLFVELRPLGPTVSAAYDAGRCVRYCPHRVQLLPLGLGYLFFGDAIAAPSETTGPDDDDTMYRWLDYTAIGGSLVVIALATIEMTRGGRPSFLITGFAAVAVVILVTATLDLRWRG